jgi:SAM-dependent methyltransferase
MNFVDILYFIFFVLLVSAGWACWRGAPWVPTRKKDVERFLKLAEIKPGQKFYDLGCGDGRLVITATKAGANAIGFELSLAQYLHAKINVLLSVIPAKAGIQSNTQNPGLPNQVGNDKIKIQFQDFWNINLSDADIVYLFLMQSIYPKLKAKFEKELKPNAKIIVYAWPIQGWTPIKIDQSPNSLPIYLYQR